jgi:DNA repair exonuclease SbcCD ATPase subunit
LEALIEQAKTDATGEAQRAEQVTQTSKSKITALETQLTTTEEMVREKESAIKALEQVFTAKIQELESHVRDKDKLLVRRVKQVSELTSQLKALEDGVRKMSSFFRSAESLSAIEAQSVGVVLPVVQPQGEEEPALAQLKNPTVPRDKTDETTSETISAEFFRRMTDELSDILGPMAPMIIRHDAMALGESMDNFPKSRVTELLDSITKEVSDEKLKNAFLKRLGF